MLRILLAFLIYNVSLNAQQDSNREYAQMTFLDNDYHFGVIKEGEVVQNVFQFTNTGSVPLVISNARGNCGCTIPEYPKEPILPGESAKLLVKFNSKRKKGRQKKGIIITANTDPELTIIHLIGYVTKEAKSKSYQSAKVMQDVRVEDLLLSLNPLSKTLTIDLSAYVDKTATIEIYNESGQIILNKNEVALNEILEVDTAEFLPGVYVVSISIAGMNRITEQISML